MVAFLEGVLGSRESVKRDEDLNSKLEREVWRGERFEGEFRQDLLTSWMWRVRKGRIKARRRINDSFRKRVQRTFR